jgi:hypothetical protein
LFAYSTAALLAMWPLGPWFPPSIFMKACDVASCKSSVNTVPASTPTAADTNCLFLTLKF